MWSVLAAALDLCLLFDAHFGSAISDQLICQARVGSKVGKKATQLPGRRILLIDLAALVLCGLLRGGALHLRSTAALCSGVLGLDALVTHGFYDTCCL